jgi:DNA-binding MarR family transcriptional regulator
MAGKSRTDEATRSLLGAVRGLDLAIEAMRSAFSRRYGITVNDSLVMSHLSVAGRRLRPSELTERLMITSGSLTPMLDRLEAAGFIEREPNPDDRRSLTVVLTDIGESTLFTYRDQFIEAIRTAIPAQLRRPLTECVTHLSGAFDEVTLIFDRERRAGG